uniref:Uncharacterized protein n=1 Tax=Rhizophora mucronata TaxID=61149 RepID=A0A2P2MFT4_RHIMU
MANMIAESTNHHVFGSPCIYSQLRPTKHFKTLGVR